MIRTATAVVSAMCQPPPTSSQPIDRCKREDMHEGRVEARDPVGEADIAAGRVLGGFHQPDDLGEERVAGLAL